MGLNLTTRADYKAYAGISSTNQDVIIDSLIAKTSELVKNYCRRTFVDHWDSPKTEYFDGGTKELILSEGPVVAISSVSYSEDMGRTYTDIAEYDYWVLDGDYIRSTSTDGYFTEKIKAYKVVYTGGYEDVPYDLEVAVMDIVTYYLKNSAAVHSSRQLTPNTMQVEYISGSQFPAHIKRVLDLYKANYL